MANKQHLEWLREGVESWNARRAREDFNPDLRGANLQGAHLQGADLRRADLPGADLRGAVLEGAVLEGAVLWGADLQGADLRGAVLRGPDLREALLRGADLQGADVRSFDLVHGRIVYSGAATRGGVPEFVTDLSTAIHLTQEQVDGLRGDRWTKIPENLTRPAHWRGQEGTAAPALPAAPEPGTGVEEVDGQLRPVPALAPDRADLATIYGDLREDMEILGQAGSLHNASQVFTTTLDRFTRIVGIPYEHLDQVRFGVQTNSLRLRFEAERGELAEIAPDRMGALEAALLSAELLTARLPDWQAFLSENAERRDAVAGSKEEVAAAIDAARGDMEADPAHFDPRLPAWIEEYLDERTVESLQAAIALVHNMAFKAFTLVRQIVRDTASEVRKRTVQALAVSFVGAMAAVLGKLAGVVPAEFHWTLAWLKYVPTVF